MRHRFVRVKEVNVLNDYTLRILFNDGSETRIDFEPVLIGDIYGPLKDKSLFNQVKVDTEVGTLVWPNGADYDASMLYLWDDIKDAFIDQMNRVESGQAKTLESP